MNIVQRCIIGLAMILTLAFSTQDANQYSNEFKRLHMKSLATLVEKPVVAKKPVVKRAKRVYRGDVKAFMQLMARVESDNTPTARNRFGMLGKYQFSPKTIRALGYSVSADEFLSDPSLQDEVMVKYMKDNRRTLSKLIRNYAGLEVNGVVVTESGILAGAHLAGTGGLLAFFYPEKYGYRTSDANGTSVAYYMKKFSGYDLSGM